MLRVTGFGQTGPYAKRRAFGTLAEAMSGFAHQTGNEDGPPTLPPFGLADGVAGIAGAFAVMTALYHRATPEANGQGQVIDLSLLEPLVGILGPGPTAFDQLGAVAGRQGNRSPNNAPRNAYLTKDGRWVAISASATSVAERVMRLVGRPDIVEQPWFASAGERSRNGDLLDEAVAKWIAARPLHEVSGGVRTGRRGTGADLRRRTTDERSPCDGPRTDHHRRRRGPRPGEDAEPHVPHGPHTRLPSASAGRRLGQDNEQFYRESLGLDPEHVAALKEKGVL